LRLTPADSSWNAAPAVGWVGVREMDAHTQTHRSGGPMPPGSVTPNSSPNTQPGRTCQQHPDGRHARVEHAGAEHRQGAKQKRVGAAPGHGAPIVRIGVKHPV
jgi:hypothetical protein